MNSVSKYINIVYDGESYIIKCESTKALSAHTTLTNLQKAVDSKKSILNKTEFSIELLPDKILVSFEKKLTFWQKIIDNLLRCFCISTKRNEIHQMAKALFCKLNQAHKENLINQNGCTFNQNIPNFNRIGSSHKITANEQQISTLAPRLEFLPLQPFPESSLAIPDCRLVFSNAVKKIKSFIKEIVNKKAVKQYKEPSNTEKIYLKIKKSADVFRKPKGVFGNALSSDEKAYLKSINIELAQIEGKVRTLTLENADQVLSMVSMLTISSPIYAQLLILESLILKDESSVANVKKLENVKKLKEEISNDLVPYLPYYAINCSDLKKYIEFANKCGYQTPSLLIIRKGQYYFEKAKYSTAFKIINRQLTEYSDEQLIIMTNIAIAYFQQGKYLKSKEIVQAILNISSKDEIKNIEIKTIIKQIEGYRPNDVELKLEALKNQLNKLQKKLVNKIDEIQALNIDPHIEKSIESLREENKELNQQLLKRQNKYNQAIVEFGNLVSPSREELEKMAAMLANENSAENSKKKSDDQNKIKENENKLSDLKKLFENYKELNGEVEKIRFEVANIQKQINHPV